MSYGLCAWGLANDDILSKVQLLQKKAIRAITSAEYHAETAPIFKKLGILNLSDLFGPTDEVRSYGFALVRLSVSQSVRKIPLEWLIKIF